MRPLVLLLLAVGVLLGGFAAPVRGQGQDDLRVVHEEGARDLYLGNCASCHGPDAEGTYRGPSLHGVGSASVHFMLTTGRMPIAEPDERMRRRPSPFTNDEIQALVDYLRPVAGAPEIPRVHPSRADLARGGELYRVHCASCHEWSGNGGALVGAPPAPPLHESTPVEVAEAIRTGPGTMPVFGSDTFTDEEVDAIVAYVRYLQDPETRGGIGLGLLGTIAEGAVAALVALPLLLLAGRWIAKHDQ